jgi:hypothetical protein
MVWHLSIDWRGGWQRPLLCNAAGRLVNLPPVQDIHQVCAASFSGGYVEARRASEVEKRLPRLRVRLLCPCQKKLAAHYEVRVLAILASHGKLSVGVDLEP